MCPAMNGFGVRFLLYSHDSYGLGHFRRSLAIADALTSRFDGANVLLVTGSPCATQFDLPLNCDVLKLPCIAKDEQGNYLPRSFSGDVSRMITLRSRMILESYRAFQPHLILVDHQLTGLRSEALAMLRDAHLRGIKTIYGMRDVIDSPEAVQKEWNSHDSLWALNQGYDQICVYGQVQVFDPRQHYPMLASLQEKIEFLGYVVRPVNGTANPPVPSPLPRVLVTMGGGEDGAQRVETYLDALAMGPAEWTSHIITGPLMDRARVRYCKEQVHRLGLTRQVKISRFHSNIPRLLRRSDAVVGMAGYNSCTEIIQSRIPAVFLPRTHPRKEQLIRARRLQDLGLASCIEDLDPIAVRAAVEQALSKTETRPNCIRLDGLDGLCGIVARMLTVGADASPQVISSQPRVQSAR